MPAAKRKYTRELAEWAATLRYDDIPGRIVEEAKIQMMSIIGAIFAGYKTSAGRRLIKAIGRWAEDGDCSLMPGGEKLGLKDALAGNAALSMLLDYDDYMIAGHTGHSAVLVPLLLAEKENVSGRQVLLSQVIANEIESRIGGSVMVGPLNGQMWAFIHSVGTACAAGRIAGLDAKQMAHAIGISLAQPPRPLDAGFMAGESKLLTASAPMCTGIFAAQFAAEGMTGPDDVLETQNGFCETFSFVPMYPMLTRLSECWLSDTLSYKLYPGCAYVDAMMDGVMEICREKEVHPDEIFKIDVYAGMTTVKMNDISRPFIRHQKSHPVTLNFYTPYNVAVAILDGELGPAQFEPSRIDDPAVWALAKKVRTHHDVTFTTDLIDSLTDLIDIRYMLSELSFGSLRSLVKHIGPASPILWLTSGREITQLVSEGRRALEKFTGISGRKKEVRLAKSAEGFRMALGARVVFDMKAKNKVYEFEQKIPFGAAGWPLEDKQMDVIGKFKRESANVINPDAAEAAIDLILRLEELDNAGVRDLIGLCCTSKAAG